MRAATLPRHSGTPMPLRDPAFFALAIFGVFFFFSSIQSSPAPSPGLVDDTNSLALAPSVDRSLNWSGYVAGGSDYTAISGSWVVPQVSGGTLSADATWVGIGGTASRNLIQAGTQAIVDYDGTVVY